MWILFLAAVLKSWGAAYDFEWQSTDPPCPVVSSLFSILPTSHSCGIHDPSSLTRLILGLILDLVDMAP